MLPAVYVIGDTQRKQLYVQYVRSARPSQHCTYSKSHMNHHTAHDGSRMMVQFDQKRAKSPTTLLARLHLHGLAPNRTNMRFETPS